MKFDSEVVVLIDAGVAYRADGELWGALVVRKKEDGSTRMYAQYLPQFLHPNPPGWAAIADLTGVSAADVVAGWDETGHENITAARAFETLKEEVGKEFVVREIEGIGERAAELVSTNITDAATQLDLDNGQVVDGDLNVNFTQLVRLSTRIDPNDLEPPVIVIESTAAPEYVIQVPDSAHNSDPADWFFIETFIEAPAAVVAYSWTRPGAQKQSTMLTFAVSRLQSLLFYRQELTTTDAEGVVHLQEGAVGLHAPMRDGLLDLDGLRRALVRDRIRADRGANRVEPLLFLCRSPRDVASNSWTLLKDCIGPPLFRYNVERGASSGCPAVVRTVDGSHKLEVLDTTEKMRGILMQFIDFVVPAKKGIKYLVPPDAITDHMTIFPDQSVPAIDTISRIPTVRRDGTIHDTEGYDPKSRIWYAPSFALEPIPNQPTDSDVRAAYGMVVAPLAEFPFVGVAGGLTAAVACLLDQIVRPMITGPRPIYAFDAPAMRGQGTGKCCENGSLVLSSAGLIPIEELAPRAAPAETVLAYGPHAPRLATAAGTKRAASHFFVGGAKVCRRLRTRRGFMLGGTLDHPVRVATPAGPAWRKLRDVAVGDYVAVSVSRHPGAETDQIDEDCAWLLGTLTADGSLNEYEYKSAPGYSKLDPELRDRVAALSISILHATSVTDVWRDDHIKGLNIFGSRVRERMHELDLTQTTAAYKRIPRTVLRSSSRIWAAFIRGLFDGDGHVDKQGLEWTTASSRLSREVQVMLAALGVWSTRKPKKVQLAGWKKPKTYWRTTFSGADLDAFAANIGLTKTDKAARLHARVTDARKRNTNIDVVPRMGALIRDVFYSAARTKQDQWAWKREMANKNDPSRARLRSLLESSPKSEAKSILTEMTAEHVRWDRVEVLQDAGLRAVSDLTIPEEPSFVANGIQVHNSLLAGALGAIITGRPIEVTSWPDDPKELPKIITAKLLTGESYVVFDNLEGAVKHKDLAALATATTWSSRLLHTNDSPKLPQTATWCLTLNGARFNLDIARRTITIRLDARTSKPFQRSGFKIETLIPWCIQHRANIIRACLILARAWVVAGRPKDTRLRVGSFESWAKVVGGILNFAGLRDLPLALEESQQRETDAVEHERFIQLWAQYFPDEMNVTASHLAEMCIQHSLYQTVLESVKSPVWRGRHLSEILRKMDGHVFAEWRVECVDGKQNGHFVYRLRRVPNAG